MTKIEKMAEAYGNENPFTWYDADACANENTVEPAIAYEAGANAVISELRAVIENEPSVDISKIREVIDSFNSVW